MNTFILLLAAWSPLGGEIVRISDPPGYTLDLGVTPFRVPVTRDVTLTNYGDTTAEVTGFHTYGWDANQFKTVGPTPFLLAPGATQVIQVTFLATAPGNSSADYMVVTRESYAGLVISRVKGRAEIGGGGGREVESSSCGLLGLEALLFLAGLRLRRRLRGGHR